MCDQLENDKVIMKAWMNRIQNKYKEMYGSQNNNKNNNKSSNIVIQDALLSDEVETNNLDYNKVWLDRTFKLIDNYPENFKGRVYISAFSINNILVRPFLEYLLVKNPPNHVKEPNELYFPFFDSVEETDIEEESNVIINQIFKKSKYVIDFIGHCIINNSCYLLFDTGSKKYGPKEKQDSSYWWWTTIYEIVETGMIFDFTINNSVKELFKYEPGLCRLISSNTGKVLENPIIAYQYESNEEIHKNVLFGPTRLHIQNKGLFIICSQLKRTKKLALLGLENPFIELNNEPNYFDNQNNNLLMRLAIFKGNSILISNTEFEDIKSKYHNLSSFNIQTLMVDYTNNSDIKSENDIVFLLKDDSRCYFINYIKLSFNNNIINRSNINKSENILKVEVSNDTHNSYDSDNDDDTNYLSENSDTVLIYKV